MSSLSTSAAAAASSQVKESSPVAEAPGEPASNDDDSSTLDQVDVSHLLVMKKAVSRHSTCVCSLFPLLH